MEPRLAAGQLTERGAPRARGRRALGVVAALLATAPAVAYANENTAFDAAQAAYDSGQYEQAEKLFERLLDAKNPPCATADAGAPCKLESPDLIRVARADRAASLVDMKRGEEADVLFELILRDDPMWQPNTALFPEPALRAFLAVKRRMQPELDRLMSARVSEASKRSIAQQRAKEEYQRWLTSLEQAAGENRVFQRNSRLFALIPFGVGQFQNGDRSLGFVLLGSELALAGGTLVSAIAANHYQLVNPYNPGGTDSAGNPQQCNAACKAALPSDLATATDVNHWVFAAWIGVMVGGVVQSEVAFVAETPVRTRRRPVPPPPAVLPTFSFVPGGAVVGATGRF